MLTFDPNTHSYEIDGVAVKSVTQICAPLSLEAAIAGAQRPHMRDAAANRGTRVHEFCELIDLGIEPEAVDFDCVGYVEAYKSFLFDYRPKDIAAVELPIGSLSMGVAGTLDRLMLIDGMWCLIDLKTGTHIDKATCTAQLNGYNAIINAHDCTTPTLPRPQALAVLQLGRRGKYSYKPMYFSTIFDQLLCIENERRFLSGK